jgi:hypothetical protein
MYNLIYVSQSTASMSAKELAAILQKSRNCNTRDGVTGLLIYKYTPAADRANFIQLLEGDKDKVQAAFQRICADKRHHTIILLEEGEIEDRNFPSWSMGFRNVAASDLVNFEGFSDLGTEHFWEQAGTKTLDSPMGMLKSFYADEFADD